MTGRMCARASAALPRRSMVAENGGLYLCESNPAAFARLRKPALRSALSQSPHARMNAQSCATREIGTKSPLARKKQGSGSLVWGELFSRLFVLSVNKHITVGIWPGSLGASSYQ